MADTTAGPAQRRCQSGMEGVGLEKTGGFIDWRTSYRFRRRSVGGEGERAVSVLLARSVNVQTAARNTIPAATINGPDRWMLDTRPPR